MFTATFKYVFPVKILHLPSVCIFCFFLPLKSNPCCSYSGGMEGESNEYMKAALCQIKEENQHNSA